MVISKDSKRKRKSPQPVESSPEMPKRTKVQAQRKFAQGQSAPASSYNALAAASSSSTTGPSTSSECREPPTEILPNKRPKPEDFVTFMCYHRMSGLPSHLDFLNKGKSQVNDSPAKKPLPKSIKPTKKGKKGRQPKTAAKQLEPQASTSIAASVIAETSNQNDATTTKTTSIQKAEIKTVDGVSKDVPPPSVPIENTTIPSFAVRKRAEVIAEGNRRGRASERQLRNIGDVEKCNNSPESKRRSNRTNAKEAKPMVEPETDEDEEYFSTKEDVEELETKEIAATSKNDFINSKTPVPQERKSETPSKGSESGKSHKDKGASTKTKVYDSAKENKTDAIKSKEPPKPTQKPTELSSKEKAPAVKRQRQKESPIFIPSPEPSGRMTRQRAFFEPVKVPHREDDDQVGVEEPEEFKDVQNVGKLETISKKKKPEKEDSKKVKPLQIETSPSYGKMDDTLQNSEKNHDKNKSMNVFDFSSDDEQPLVKTVKSKKGKVSPKKISTIGNKFARKPILKRGLEKNDEKTTNVETKNEPSIKVEDATAQVKIGINEDHQNDSNKSKSKRGKIHKKKIEQSEEETKEAIAPSSPKKITNSRQSRKKTKCEIQLVNGENENDVSPTAPLRNQRPTRKTKEAAAIYMGIIGHKLQLADDEDDDLSLNSFPDLPNVKEMEKMEIELKRNAAHTTTSSPIANKVSTPKQATNESPIVIEKPIAARRGRPPKQPKQAPVKREIEGMLVKKGALTKIAISADVTEQKKTKSEISKIESEDEDFLLNEELNETKRKLEKSFSDSDDEPLAIKAHVKPSDKDQTEQSLKKSHGALQNTTLTTTSTVMATLPMLPLMAKPVPSPPVTSTPATNVSPISAAPQAPSPFKTIEKKSPVPTSKILNVPATYGIPTANSMTSNVSASINAAFNKSSSTYLPQASPHYHGSHARTTGTTHQFTAAKTPVGSTTPVHIAAPLPPQSPIKYQAPPTTYAPPIEAYPSPKINPNFLTPKFDRTTMPRSNNFPSPSPMKFDMSSTTSKAGITVNSTHSPKTTIGGVSVTSTTALAAANSSDPLKDEIGSILAANLMPSKEESGKIFGIASVSLAQSSGPDNTKCTLGKCGSIHKPVLGPVVPTEGYIGDQLSSKERRKAKVNMTHEQIQKWLIECSSNPDEILDDLDDDYDDNLRPNLFATTPPPTRDDKESTSFSSSSKATRDLGKSESAWSAKGPSLKATPVVASANRKDEGRHLESVSNPLEIASDNEKTSGLAINLTHKAGAKMQTLSVNEVKTPKEKAEKKPDKKTKEDKLTSKEASANKDSKQNRIDKEKEPSTHTSSKTAVSGKQSNIAASQKNLTSPEPPSTSKQSRKRAAVPATPATASVETPSTNTQNLSTNAASNTSATSAKTPKRTPVYNQKMLKQIELKETTTTSHKKTAPFSYGAFSADNEKSIYSFDKDDDAPNGSKGGAKPVFQRQNRRDSQPADDAITTTTTNRTSPTKKRAAAAAAEKANKEIANASQNSSVSLTLSPSENCKLVKVSLDAEKTSPAKTTTGKTSSKTNKTNKKAGVTPAADSDSEGHTFYIPLQGSGTGCDGEGGIQGVAVKLGREGPDGPNQKVIMHATLVTKAQMGSNSKPLPDSMNVSDIVKTLVNSAAISATVDESSSKKGTHSSVNPSTSAAAAANSAPNSLKNVPIGTVQPRFKASDAAIPSNTPVAGTGSSLVRVNSSSSLFSGSAKSRIGVPGPSAIVNKKFKDDMPIKMSNNTAFPRHDDPTQMVEAPIFRPTEKEFADPIEFIERITPIAARFGICKIIPPATFKPECRISDEMRFTAYNQYVHKMLHRWGPSAKELSAIKKYLATQSIAMNHPPWIGGMEVDLPRLYHTVQELGGLKEVIEKKKWARVAEEMCIPKLAQDRVTKLDDIYCKYLLPYDTLSPAERQKLFDEVEADWAKREARARRNADRFVNTESVSNEEDDVSSEDDEESEEEVDGVSMECIVKGRSMPLSQFYRIARNTMSLWFKNTEPTVNEVEAEFWRHVAVCDSHVCVHSGSIDSSGWGYGFPSPGPKGKGSNYARHPWNLKVLTNNAGSVLRSLGPVMGVTVPTLHVGMLFSACCWYRDPHGLSWIEYLHTGASKLWYGIPDDQSANFRAALTALIPTHCQNKTIWLPCDTVMVPPHMLTDRGVSLCRIEQKPGEFIVVFPRAYTSSVATGYVVSESVYFATTSWLDLAKDDFRDIHDSCEPAMFSLEQLLFALGHDQRVTLDALQQMQPMLNDVFEKETAAREQLKAAGVTSAEKALNEKGSKAKKQQHPVKSIDSECDLCRANLYISMVRTDDGNVYCLQHALKNLNNGNIQAKQCKLIYAYNVDDIENLIKSLKDKMQQKQRVAVVNKKVK